MDERNHQNTASMFVCEAAFQRYRSKASAGYQSPRCRNKSRAECGQLRMKDITRTPLPCSFVKLLSATPLLAVLIKPMSFNFGFLYWTGFQLVAPFAKPVLGSWVGDPETNPDSGHLPSGWMWPPNHRNTASMFVCEAAVSNTTSSCFDQTHEF